MFFYYVGIEDVKIRDFAWNVLNLTVAMKPTAIFIFIMLLISAPALSAWQVEPVFGILTPAAGDAVRGVVRIEGTTDTAGFNSAEVSFGYSNDTTETWFLLAQSEEAVQQGQLALWDTTSIPDGTYRLRLRIFLTGGGVMEYAVDGLRVRNYSAVETPTPNLAAITPSMEPAQPTLTSTPVPTLVQTTATPYPTNAAVINQKDLDQSLKNGAVLGLGLFILLFLFLTARAAARRR